MKDFITELKLAMDYDHQGEWDKAHKIVQNIKHELAYRIHAYLHRKEDDINNANYWYRRIGIEPFGGTFEFERKDIMEHLLNADV